MDAWQDDVVISEAVFRANHQMRTLYEHPADFLSMHVYGDHELLRGNRETEVGD